MAPHLSGKAKVGLGLAGLVLAAIGVFSASAPHWSRDTYRATVTDKQIKRYDNKDKYLIFTKLEDGSVRVFENTDSTLEMKWNSSDFQAMLEVGKTYDIKTYGWRVPLASSYENVIGVTEVKK